jgi:hypothetical protein
MLPAVRKYCEASVLHHKLLPLRPLNIGSAYECVPVFYAVARGTPHQQTDPLSVNLRDHAHAIPDAAAFSDIMILLEEIVKPLMFIGFRFPDHDCLAAERIRSALFMFFAFSFYPLYQSKNGGVCLAKLISVKKYRQKCALKEKTVPRVVSDVFSD